MRVEPKIVPIFADTLFAFRYDGEDDNEYDRLMELWTDTNYLREFAIDNSFYLKEFIAKDESSRYKKFIKKVLDEAREIQDILDEIETKGERLEMYFSRLHDSELGVRVLSLQKGKIQRGILRIYAVKIDENCFIITGGAIKLWQKMSDHYTTLNERNKLAKAKALLESLGATDKDSFFELL